MIFEVLLDFTCLHMILSDNIHQLHSSLLLCSHVLHVI